MVYLIYKIDNWPKLLLIAIFAYNNSIYSLTNKAPHKLLKGYPVDFT